MRQAFLLVVVVAITLMRVRARRALPRPARWRSGSRTRTRPRIGCSSAVHGGAGRMSFTALLNRGAVTPEFNFLHRGVIPAGAGIGHHFHNVVEEMFVILDGEAQFTIDGRTASVKGPAGVLCRTGHSHAIYNPGPTPVQWMNLNVSLVPGVYDNFDLGDTRVAAALGCDPHVHDDPTGQVAAESGGRTRTWSAAPRHRLRTPSSRGASPGRRCSRRPGPISITCSSLPARRLPNSGMTASARRITCSAAREPSASRAVESGTAAVRAGDAIPVRIGETTRFTSTGSAPLELFVMGVAKDAAAKTQLLTGAQR